MQASTYKYTEEDLRMIQIAESILKQQEVELSTKLSYFLLEMTNQESLLDRDNSAYLFRDAAIKLKNKDISASYHLMSLAHRLKPQGSFIKKKVNTLEQLIRVAEQGICKLGGLDMEFGENPPPVLLNALFSGSYEQNEVSLLKQFLGEGEVVLELGAGIGYMGVTALKSGLCQRYVAYEANPDLIPIIKNNMRRNNAFFELKNAILLNDKVLQPFYVTPAFWASSIKKPIDGAYKKILIQAQNKNEVIQSIAPTMLIIDIEGGEADFFEGLYLDSVQKIILEIHPMVLSDDSLSTIYSFLLREGFVLNFKSSFKNVLYWYR